MKVFVTGANGFVGRHACLALEAAGCRVVRAVRNAPLHPPPPGVDAIVTGDLSTFEGLDSTLSSALRGVDAVLHLAGRAHVLRDRAADPAAEFHAVNVVATERLAKAAIAAGVRRFVFVSSIGVYGTRSDHPLTENDAPRPTEEYARSKLEAERRLLAVGAGTALETVIVRPPLVYGPHCPGNLARLVRLVRRGWPLPFARFDARRSLVGVQNLSSLLHLLVTHPAAPGGVFVAADGEDLTLAELLRHLYAGLGMSSRLVPMPVSWVHALARLAGAGSTLERLAAPLLVDASRARRMLGWKPPVDVASGLRATAASFAPGAAAVASPGAGAA